MIDENGEDYMEVEDNWGDDWLDDDPIDYEELPLEDRE